MLQSRLKLKNRDRVDLHPLLIANFDGLNPPTLSYDLSRSPSHARVRHDSGRYTYLPADRRAVTNVSPTAGPCVLTFDNGVIADCCFIDVGSLSLEDFLWMLYEHLQDRLSLEESEALEDSRTEYHRARRAMERRCAAASDLDREWREGLRRIDCLGKATRLWGVYVDALVRRDL
jgi:hypothetical protein